MATFYGQISGNRGTGSRLGTKASGLTVSAQSWDGSVITQLSYDSKDTLKVKLSIDDGSSFYGETMFNGTLEELKAIFKKAK